MDAGLKRQLGIHYTIQNPFHLVPFCHWASSIQLKSRTVLEPFAGANNIIRLLEDKIKDYKSYDIKPESHKVSYQDTIKNFPKAYDTCITNPPWLSSYFAKRNKVEFPRHIPYDNLYKFCLEQALLHCENVAMLLPASFLTSGLFHDRLDSLILINSLLFASTDNPTCLALFKKSISKDIKIYENNTFLGIYSELKRALENLEKTNSEVLVKFNVSEGSIGIRNIDNSLRESIVFCLGKELAKYNIKPSSRLITRAWVPLDFSITKDVIERFNVILSEFRDSTKDIFLTPFKGLRKDGRYRRRLDYNLARMIINAGLRKRI